MSQANSDSEMILLNGAQLRIAVSGHGRPMLLIPGGAGCSDYLGPLADALGDVATIYRIEPRGCGESTADGRYDTATTLADIEALREHYGLQRWLVAGHSHGAFYALAYALQYPARAEGVIYLAGTGLQSDRSWQASYEAGREAGLDQEVPDGTYTWNPEVNKVANAEYKSYVRRPGLWRDVAELTVPFRAVYGGQDIRPLWPVEQLVELMPDATLDLLPDAPHAFWYTHAEELSRLMRRYLKEGSS